MAFKTKIAAVAAFAVAVPQIAAGQAPPIPPGDHYVCYPVVKSGRRPDIGRLEFEDQFGTHTVVVLAVTRLCAPALKRRAGEKPVPVRDPRLHLVCYSIRATETHIPPVTTHDQFTPNQLALGQPNEVCLPAGKTPLKG